MIRVLPVAPQNMPEYVTLNKTADNVIGVHFKGVTTGPDEEPLDGYKVSKHISKNRFAIKLSTVHSL